MSKWNEGFGKMISKYQKVIAFFPFFFEKRIFLYNFHPDYMYSYVLKKKKLKKLVMVFESVAFHGPLGEDDLCSLEYLFTVQNLTENCIFESQNSPAFLPSLILRVFLRSHAG